MKKFMVALALLLGSLAPAFAAPRQMVDYDFGTQQVAWKLDGSQLALQDKHGIAIRDAHNLRLLRYFPLEQNGNGWPSLQAWSGGTLIFQANTKKEDDSSGENIGASNALLLSSQDGKPRTTWQGVWFSPSSQTLWFRRGSHFHVFDWMNNRWFDANLPFRQSVSEQDGFRPRWPPQITFSANGRFAADQLEDGQMRLWKVATRKVTAILKDATLGNWYYPLAAFPLVWSPDGKRVVTLGEDPEHSDITYDDGGPNDGVVNWHPPVVKIWDAHSGKLIQWFNTQSLGFSTYSPTTYPVVLTWLDNEQICVGNQGAEVRRVGSNESLLLGNGAPVAISPDKISLFISHNLVRLSSGNKTRVINSLLPPPPLLNHVAWSSDGRFLSASYYDIDRRYKLPAGIFIWNTSNWESQSMKNTSHPGEIGWTHDNRLWTNDGTIITSWQANKAWAQSQWQVPSPAEVFSEPRRRSLNAVIALPDANGVVQIFNNYNGGQTYREVYECKITGKPRLLTSYIKESGSSNEMISPDGKWICFWTNTNQTPIFHAYELRENGQHIELNQPATWELSIKFSPDSRFLTWGGNLYQWPSGKIVSRSTFAKEESVLALAPGAKNALLLAPNNVRLFNCQSRTMLPLTHNTKDVADTQFSPDGTRLALSRFRSVEIYSTKTGQRIATLYAWPRTTPIPGLDWLSLQPDGKVKGTPAARQQVVSVP